MLEPESARGVLDDPTDVRFGETVHGGVLAPLIAVVAEDALVRGPHPQIAVAVLEQRVDLARSQADVAGNDGPRTAVVALETVWRRDPNAPQVVESQRIDPRGIGGLRADAAPFRS